MVDVCLQFLPGLFCGIVYLLSVLVCARVEKYFIFRFPPDASENIRLHKLKRVSDMRIGVYIRERGGKVARTHDRNLRVFVSLAAFSLVKVRNEFKYDRRDRHREENAEKPGERIARHKRH